MKIVGMAVVGAGEADRYLEQTLKEFERLTDDALICLNSADKKVKKMVEKYGFWWYEDFREWGLHQPTIKTELLRKVLLLKPDWVLPLDADETFTPDLTRKKLEALTEDKIACYFYIINLWDSPERYSKGLSFWNIRFFKPKPEYGYQFLKKPVHCGLAPPYAYKFGTYVPYLVRHYGLMKAADRQKKVERYEIYDPQAIHKSRTYYDALKQNSVCSPYDEVAVQNKIKAECEKMVYQKKYK